MKADRDIWMFKKVQMKPGDTNFILKIQMMDKDLTFDTKFDKVNLMKCKSVIFSRKEQKRVLHF